MPVVFQKWIKRQDLKDNPDKLYLFGDNDQRYGLGGQAKEMRGEPNALGIVTKKEPNNNENSFLKDEHLGSNIRFFMDDMSRAINFLQKGGTVVIPEDGLGTGLSQLPTKAPKTNEFLSMLIEWMETI